MVAALLHDIGDELAPHTHSEMVGAILGPYVSEEICWIVGHHGAFQMYYYAEHYDADPNVRERFRDEPVLRRMRRVLRALRPEMLRPGIRVAARRVLRADGEARVRRASLPAGVAPRTGRAPATRTGGRSWRPGSASRRASPRSFSGCPSWRPELQSHFHLSLEGVGVVLASINLGVLATVLPWGILANRVGDRAVIAVGLGPPRSPSRRRASVSASSRSRRALRAGGLGRASRPRAAGPSWAGSRCRSAGSRSASARPAAARRRRPWPSSCRCASA